MLRLIAAHDVFSGIDNKSVDNLRRVISRNSIWFAGIRMCLPVSSSSENRLSTPSLSPPCEGGAGGVVPFFFGNSSSPPRTPPTRGGEYSLFPCIPPPVPLTEGDKGGGGRFRWGLTVTNNDLMLDLSNLLAAIKMGLCVE